jgi:hypothetical protein
MNLFYLDRDPVVAASYHYDKHKVKMVLEAAQMLCTAHHCYGSSMQKANVPYKQAHLNHPSTIWVRRSRTTYLWAYEYMIALGKEYTKRYGKEHLTITKCRDFLSTPPIHVQGDEWVEPPQCMPDEYKVQGDSISAYWNYYEQDKYKIANKNEQIIIRPSYVNECV